MDILFVYFKAQLMNIEFTTINYKLCQQTPQDLLSKLFVYFFFLFLAGNTKFQRIWRKGMPYNAIWIINLLNEDEFVFQNYLNQGGSVDNTVQDLRA